MTQRDCRQEQNEQAIVNARADECAFIPGVGDRVYRPSEQKRANEASIVTLSGDELALRGSRRGRLEADCEWRTRLSHRDHQIMAPDDHRILRSELSQGPAAFSERRPWPRHQLRDARGALGWREIDQEVTCGMTMVEISSGGAAVLAEHAPPLDHPIWLELEFGAAGRERLEARVVSISPDASGLFLVRMQFTSWKQVGSLLEKHEEHRLW
jgi:PilZ domain